MLNGILSSGDSARLPKLACEPGRFLRCEAHVRCRVTPTPRRIRRTMTEAQANGALILVVDDDDRSRELMRIVLRHAGYRVVAAPGPQAAIAMLATERPAAAVVDLLMPDMNGLEFCRWVREQPELASMRFVLLTGMDTQETRNDARDAGADAVVTKPFDRIRLLAQLGALLDPAPVAVFPEERKAR